MVADDEESFSFLPFMASSGAMLPNEDLDDNDAMDGTSNKQNSKKQKSSNDSNSIPKPKRPLSAYNLFFRSEREKMLRSAEQEGSKKNDDFGNDKQASRPKIGFAPMARTIATKWKNIEPSVREYFDEIAAQDKARYAREKEQWKERMAKMTTASTTELSVRTDAKKRKQKKDEKSEKVMKKMSEAKNTNEDEETMWNNINDNATQLQMLLKLQKQRQQQQQTNSNNDEGLMMLLSQQKQLLGSDFKNVRKNGIKELQSPLLSSCKEMMSKMTQNQLQQINQNNSFTNSNKNNSTNPNNGDSILSLMIQQQQQQQQRQLVQQQQQLRISQLAAKLDSDCLDFLSNLC